MSAPRPSAVQRRAVRDPGAEIVAAQPAVGRIDVGPAISRSDPKGRRTSVNTSRTEVHFHRDINFLQGVLWNGTNHVH
jgi:hypothetical protein